MSPTLLSSPLFFNWAWIASISIIDAFHLNFPCLGSYHHIPYPLCVDVYHALHILIVSMAIDSFDMHPPHPPVFLVLSSFFHEVVRKATKRFTPHLHQYITCDWETLKKEHTIKG